MVLPTVTGASKGQHTESSRSPASTQAAYSATMSRDGMAGFLRPSPDRSASGLFVPKPSRGASYLHCGMHDWGTTVRQRPLASTFAGGDCYSLGYSVL